MRARYDNEISIIIPIYHDYVVIERPPSHRYKQVEERLVADRASIASFLQELAPYLDHEKLARIGAAAGNATDPYWNQPWFPPGDARAAYAIVGRFRPRRIIEIGSGNSTKFLRRAIADFDTGTHLCSIDPLPRVEVDDLCDQVVRASLLEADLGLFAGLSAGDVLSLDGSHLVLNGTDTVHFFLEILPLVADGVLVHVHDICLPFEYVAELQDRGYAEQYLVAAAILTSAKWEILLPVYYLRASGRYPHDGSSFWFRKRPSRTGPDE